MIKLNTWLQNNERNSAPLFIRKDVAELWQTVRNHLKPEDSHAVVTGILILQVKDIGFCYTCYSLKDKQCSTRIR